MMAMIRFELQTTDYTSLSPVSGLLNMIALWLNDPNDADLHRARNSFEGWIWQDEEAGLRVTGARSSTWDTSFAIQALQAASPHVDVFDNLWKGQQFLSTQQIRKTFANLEMLQKRALHHRIDLTTSLRLPLLFVGLYLVYLAISCPISTSLFSRFSSSIVLSVMMSAAVKNMVPFGKNIAILFLLDLFRVYSEIS